MFDEFPAKEPSEESFDRFEVVDAEDPLEVVVKLKVRSGEVDGLVHGSDEERTEWKREGYSVDSIKSHANVSTENNPYHLWCIFTPKNPAKTSANDPTW